MDSREGAVVQEKYLEVIKERPNDASEDLDDDSSHSSQHGSSTTGSAAENASNFGQSRDQRVSISKFVVIFVLMVSSIAIGTLTYILLSDDEEEDFQNHFRFVAEELAFESAKRASGIFVAVNTMASLFPSFSHQTGDILPRITIEDFEPFGAGTRDIGQFDFISYCPLLFSAVDVDIWNQYSVNNTAWIPHGREFNHDEAHSFAHGFENNDQDHGHMRSLQVGLEESDEDGDGDHDEHEEHGEHGDEDHDEHEDEHVEIEFVYSINSEGQMERERGYLGLPYAPVWQTSPVPENESVVNYNLASSPYFAELLNEMIETEEPILSDPDNVAEILGPLTFTHEKHNNTPHSVLLQPVFDNFAHEATRPAIVGVLVTVLKWEAFFQNILQEGQNGIVAVVESCDYNSTYVIHGNEVESMGGGGDLHDVKYDSMVISASIVAHGEEDTEHHHCFHTIYIFPSDELKFTYKTNKPIKYTWIVVAIFVFSALVFLMYDYFVTTRQRKTEHKAKRSTAILQELFPGRVASQLFEKDKEEKKQKKDAKHGFGNQADASTENARSIAEFYPEATILFADIAGFTAWSSIREPQSVFTLLENIFQGFDTLAKKHGVFKVETIGDCYVAVTGVPKRRQDHAVAMAQFARDAMDKFADVVRSLELKLGPDTADLAMRFGIHSGPVTAGVLRGERARFQLFGDSMNTASRIESNGQRERIHLSEQMAGELIKHGKGSWFIPRHDMIEAKGKGKLKTFWLKLNSETSVATSTVASSIDGSDNPETITDAEVLERIKQKKDAAADKEAAKMEKKKLADIMKDRDRNQRLSDWNCELLLRQLKKVVARSQLLEGDTNMEPKRHLATLARQLGSKGMAVDEVAEVIALPATKKAEYGEVVLGEDVEKQVHDYVNEIASLYNSENPFHNWEHASHVTMSVSKLLSRIVAPALDEEKATEACKKDELLHDHTYGITSDPLTHFACVFSALIHDVGHTGVSNGQLSKENEALNKLYQGKSPAEQNSIDVAWKVLMKPEYDKFRECIFQSVSSLKRFRQLLVNSIIATDIFDKDLKANRNARWEKAFHDSSADDDAKGKINRKATIVIEHIIQASDVSHVMQHWHVYQKWNERLFAEMYKAFREGRADKDPSEFWVKGELWFFDSYIIPLAKKLKECGCFGTASDEYLNYAEQNRKRWEQEGEAVTASMHEKLKKQFDEEKVQKPKDEYAVGEKVEL